MVRTLVIVAAVLLVGERIADACSHPCEEGVPLMVAPSDGASDVPLDAELKLRWDDMFRDTPDLAVEVVNGDEATVVIDVVRPEPGKVTYIVLRPEVAWLPETTYAIHYVGYGDVDMTAGYFTTGTTTIGEVDPAPPFPDYLFAVGQTFDCTYDGSIGIPACCVPRPVADVEFNPGVQGGPITRTFTIRDRGEIVATNLTGIEKGLLVCDEQTVFDCRHATAPYRWMIVAGAHELTVEAVDLAGNVSAPIAFDVALECRDVPAVDDPDAGCGCTGTSAPASALPIALAGLLARRRKRHT